MESSIILKAEGTLEEWKARLSAAQKRLNVTTAIPTEAFVRAVLIELIPEALL